MELLGSLQLPQLTKEEHKRRRERKHKDMLHHSTPRGQRKITSRKLRSARRSREFRKEKNKKKDGSYLFSKPAPSGKGWGSQYLQSDTSLILRNIFNVGIRQCRYPSIHPLQPILYCIIFLRCQHRIQHLFQHHIYCNNAISIPSSSCIFHYMAMINCIYFLCFVYHVQYYNLSYLYSYPYRIFYNIYYISQMYLYYIRLFNSRILNILDSFQMLPRYYKGTNLMSSKMLLFRNLYQIFYTSP